MSYTNHLYHIVFATKERYPFITAGLRPKLHQYLGGTVRAFDGIALAVGGTSDHVHLLAKIPAKVAVADFLSKLKANSSKWAGQITSGRFAWQTRYSSFSVSVSQVERVRRYIVHQEEHHRTQTFVEEHKRLLRMNQVEFDERRL